MRIVPTPWGPNVRVMTGDATRSGDLFSTEELHEVDSFRLAKRRDEWLLSRAVAKQLARDLGICADPRSCRIAERSLVVEGAPSGWHVSLSHSAPYAGAAVSRDPIGIDVQVLRPFAGEAAHLFLDEDQIEAMQRCAIDDRLLHFWCAKEAAWKRREGAIATLRQVPLRLLEEGQRSLRFDDAETLATGDLIVAVSGVRA